MLASPKKQKKKAREITDKKKGVEEYQSTTKKIGFKWKVLKSYSTKVSFFSAFEFNPFSFLLKLYNF